MIEFADNKYRRWYMQIVERTRSRAHGAGMERHHIVPRSLGGTNQHSNIVSLTYREHFLAHWLLVKFTEGDARRRMNFALACMLRAHDGHQRTPTARQYETAKRAADGIHLGNTYAKGNKANLGRKFSEETRRKMSLATSNQSAETRAKRSAMMIGVKLALGHKHSPETLAKFKAYQSNRPPEHRANMSASQMGNTKCRGKVLPEKTKQKISAALMGHRFSDETRAKMRAAWALRKERAARDAR